MAWVADDVSALFVIEIVIIAPAFLVFASYESKVSKLIEPTAPSRAKEFHQLLGLLLGELLIDWESRAFGTQSRLVPS